MEQRHITLCVLGVVIILAIVALVMLFSTAKTGATVGGGIYVYPKSPFPYTRHIERTEERPAAYGVQTQAQIPPYGGASRTFGGWHDEGAEIGVSKGFIYGRDPQKKIHQVLTSCTGQANIGAIPAGYTRGASVQHAMDLGLEHCVKAPEQIANFAYCCKEPSAIRSY